MEKIKQFKNVIYLIIFISILLYSAKIYFSKEGYQKIVILTNEIKELEKQNEELKLQILRYEEDIQELQDPKYLEKIGRTRNGMIHKDEKVYKIKRVKNEK